jgi:hypothetical protein
MTKLLPACLVIAAIACGGGGAPIAYDDLDQELQQARCTRLVRCGLFDDQAACLTYFWVLSDPSLAGAIAAHKVDYDGQAARQCVDATAVQSCDRTADDVRSPPEACSRMFGGTLAGGAACSIDAECASGTCEMPVTCPEIGCCVGSCRAAQAPGGAGATCARSRDCAGGLICAQDRTCRAPARAGEDCRADGECAAGLACINPLSTMPGTCRALPHVGQPCPYGSCADEGLRCDNVSLPQICVAYGLVGDACSGPDTCSPYLECGATPPVCNPFPTVGQMCDAGCGGVAYCARINGAPLGTCSAPQPNGSPCTAYNECASFYCEAGPVFDSCKDAPVCF